MTALKAWLAAPAQKGKSKFMIDFLNLYDSQAKAFFEEGNDDFYNMSGIMTHKQFQRDYVKLIDGASKGVDYTPSQKDEICLYTLDALRTRGNLGPLAQLVDACLAVSGMSPSAESTAGTESTDGSVPPSTGTDGSM